MAAVQERDDGVPSTARCESDPDGCLLGDSEVVKFFKGQNVLVTGGSGFLGRLLIEKLLRSCPQIGNLYVLMRPKKGKSSEQRFKEHFNDVIYNRLKEESPNFLEQVVMVEGDTSLSDLGLSEKDKERLKENVNVVFHAAATVNFNETLRSAVNINVRGTKLVLTIAKEIKNLKAYVHISTAFSHCILNKIGENYYEPPMDPDKCISLIELMDDDMLETLTPRILGKWPNTYAFSKALGEQVVRQFSTDLPVCIVRPSIMIATCREPIPGWINNYYGPTGVVMGAAIGLMRSLHCNRDNVADIIPADYVINNVIVAAWDLAKSWEEKKREIVEITEAVEQEVDPPIYNSVSSCQNPITWGKFMKINEEKGKEIPTTLALWHYWFMLNKHFWVHSLCCFVLHTIPGVIVDALAILMGREPILLKTYKKIHKFSHVISYFCTQQWNFNNKNVLKLWGKTNPVDRKLFDFNLESLDWNDYFFYHMRGLRMYILNDPLDTVKQGKIKYKKLQAAHYIIVTALFIFLAWSALGLFRILFSLS